MNKYNSFIITSPDIYHESIESLNKLGYDVIFSYKNTNVLPPLMYHTDMQLVKISDDKYISSPECYNYYLNILDKFKVNLIHGNTFLSCNYPDDIAYNIIIGNNIAIHNFKYTDDLLKENIADKERINISQGYTACTLCMISEHVHITSDRGVYNTLKKMSDVLLVDDSSIILPGFDHGFLGGSSFMISDKLLAVNGNIKLHKDYENIKSFLSNYGIDLLSLCDKPIMDIGSFVII